MSVPGREGVLITGMGAVAPNGLGLCAYTRALREGRSGVRRYRCADERVRSSVAARVWEDVFDPASVLEAPELRRLPHLVPMALCAAREAMRRAGLPAGDGGGRGALIGNGSERGNGRAVRDGGSEGRDEGTLSRRIGLVLGTGGGGIDFTIEQAQVMAGGGAGGTGRGGAGRPSLWSITNATHGNLAGELSIRLGLRGPSWCISTGCASSSDALGLAFERLRTPDPVDERRLDAMVVVGADAHVCAETLRGMEALGVVTVGDRSEADAPGASRPFDAQRDGFVLGEGAWAVVLEREAHARARGAGVCAEVLGYGATCDAYHRVRPDPQMTECVRAIRIAAADAGVRLEDIEAAHLHGTSTRLNDELETKAVRLAFGAHADALRCSAIKSMIGHPQGACGLAAVVAAIGSLNGADTDYRPATRLAEGQATAGADAGDREAAGRARGRAALAAVQAGAFIPPTINLETPDPACDLDYTPRAAAPTDARTVLVNCLAFGAKNSALVLRAAGPGGR